METLDTVELHGVPGMQLMMVGSTTSGAFGFMTKFVKDADYFFRPVFFFGGAAVR